MKRFDARAEARRRLTAPARIVGMRRAASRDLCRLMLVSRRGPVFKGRVRVSVLVLAALACLVGSLALTALGRSYRTLSSVQAADNERIRAENAVLQMENRNLSVANRQLDRKIEVLEEMSLRIEARMQADGGK